jgi:6,7-dimethyl-8-ribityllumazine synthase
MRPSEAAPIETILGARVLIVAAPYYRDVVDAMAASGAAWITQAGGVVTREDVPGAFEIPAAIALHAAGPAPYDGYLAFGCVVRGETSHYDYVCGESARALMDLTVHQKLAIGYGILTVESMEQAHERAAADRRDKGGEASRAVAAMIAMKRRLGFGS